MSVASKPTVAVHVTCLATSTLAHALDDSSLHDNVMSLVKTVAHGFCFVCAAVVDVRINSTVYGNQLIALCN